MAEMRAQSRLFQKLVIDFPGLPSMVNSCPLKPACSLSSYWDRINDGRKRAIEGELRLDGEPMDEGAWDWPDTPGFAYRPPEGSDHPGFTVDRAGRKVTIG